MISVTVRPYERALVRNDWNPCKKRVGHGHPRRRPSRKTSLGGRPQENPNPQILRPQTLSLQNCEESDLCCSSRPGEGAVLWQPKQMHGASNPENNLAARSQCGNGGPRAYVLPSDLTSGFMLIDEVFFLLQILIFSFFLLCTDLLYV